MKIAEINSVCFGSTGTIMHGVAQKAIENGHEVKCFVPNTKSNAEKRKQDVLFGNFYLRNFSRQIAYRTGFHNFLFLNSTLSLLSKLEKFNPDIIHLHNLHENFINIPILFGYLGRKNIRVIWTLHDCWSFTGHCPYYDAAKCKKWMTQCRECPIYKEYPVCLVDDSYQMYITKRKFFNKLSDLTLVPVSYWLEGELRKSYLRNNDIVTIHNGINLDVFKPNSNYSIVKKYKLDNEKYVLGVAGFWTERKGLKDFIKLSGMLPSKVKLVLVGLGNDQIQNLPRNIIGIQQTDSQTELAALYTSAELYLNLTYEDNYPTTNMEAMACGTPVLTYRTGGSIEAVSDRTGWIVNQGDLASVIEIINKLSGFGKASMQSDCLDRSAKDFDMHKQYEKYLELFEK